MRRNKSFLFDMKQVIGILIFIGIVFAIVGIGISLIPMESEHIYSYRNGVRVESTAITASTFKLVFILVFGGVGLALLTIACVISAKRSAAKKLASQIKQNGVGVYARVYDYIPSNLRFNNRTVMRLSCIYDAPSGTQYIFKSGMLRADPRPFLPGGMVTVYYDREDMSRYFVDIDGSVNTGRVVEF